MMSSTMVQNIGNKGKFECKTCSTCLTARTSLLADQLQTFEDDFVSRFGFQSEKLIVVSKVENCRIDSSLDQMLIGGKNALRLVTRSVCCEACSMKIGMFCEEVCSLEDAHLEGRYIFYQKKVKETTTLESVKFSNVTSYHSLFENDGRESGFGSFVIKNEDWENDMKPFTIVVEQEHGLNEKWPISRWSNAFEEKTDLESDSGPYQSGTDGAWF
uniref:Yippee domain-containing protein n=1 Tax=Acrobeloides nanus TaxID=290746 RepID=A0A914C8U4_9BILA